jgi:hypothetical protein
MSPSALPWFGWLVLAVVCWFFQLMMSMYTDKGGADAWLIRGVLIAGMVMSAAIAIIRFVKWVWA